MKGVCGTVSDMLAASRLASRLGVVWLPWLLACRMNIQPKKINPVLLMLF